MTTETTYQGLALTHSKITPQRSVPLCLSKLSKKGEKGPLEWLKWKFPSSGGSHSKRSVSDHLKVRDVCILQHGVRSLGD